MASVKGKSGTATRVGKRPPADPATGRIVAFKPCPEQRNLVQEMAGMGTTHADICRLVPWPDGRAPDENTLAKHFRVELDRGMALAKLKVSKTLFQMATSGDNTAATIFYAKTRLGMKETFAVENSGPNGAPLPAAAQTFVYLPQKDAAPEEQR